MFTSGSKPEWEDLWQDVDVRVDQPKSALSLRKGEKLIDSVDNTEDIKGNNYLRGTLTITNLRLRWVAASPAGVNVSIGWGAVQTLLTRGVQSKVRGDSLALVVSAKSDGARLEFIFAVANETSAGQSGPMKASAEAVAGASSSGAGSASAAGALPAEAAALFYANALGVRKAYESSRLCRDMRMRGAMIKDKAAVQLPGERLIAVHDGVWNLSSDQGNLGVLTITDRRVMWHATLAENFNASCPYLVLKDARVRDSKFGRALVLELSSRGGDFLLGFRADPAPRVELIAKEIAALRSAALSSPDYGVDFTPLTSTSSLTATGSNLGGAGGRPVEDLSVDEGSGGGVTSAHAALLRSADAMGAYYATMRGGSTGDPGSRRVLRSPVLGLAVEEPPEGLTLDSLWSAV